MKNKEFIQAQASDMPKWAKGVVGVVIIFGVAYGGFKLLEFLC